MSLLVLPISNSFRRSVNAFLETGKRRSDIKENSHRQKFFPVIEKSLHSVCVLVSVCVREYMHVCASSARVEGFGEAPLMKIRLCHNNMFAMECRQKPALQKVQAALAIFGKKTTQLSLLCFGCE